MAQYISKDTLIEKLEEEIKHIYAGREYVGISSNEENIVRGIQMAEYIVDTIEAKEVDLEKEINQQIEKYYDECENRLANMPDDDTDISFLTLNQFAKHMWELGFKAALKRE